MNKELFFFFVSKKQNWKILIVKCLEIKQLCRISKK